MSLASLLADIDVSGLSTSSASTDPNSNSFHPFAHSLPDVSSLIKLLERTSQLSTSLNHPSYSTLDPEPRILALLQEHTSHARVLEDGKRKAREYSKALAVIRKDPSRYGEDVPVGNELLAGYLVTRIEDMTKEAGLAVYRDEMANHRTMLTCGGKLVVLDMTFNSNPSKPSSSDPSSSSPSPSRLPTDAPVTLESLHLTHDSAPQSSSSSADVQSIEDRLPLLMTELLEDLIVACMRHDARRVTLMLERYRRIIEKLVYLDELASSPPPTGGAKWLREVGNLAVLAQGIVDSEAGALTSTSTSPTLDVLLRKGHAVALPYLDTHAVSFVVHLSPRLYLSARQSDSPSDSVPMQVDGQSSKILDVPLPDLRRLMHASEDPNGRPPSGPREESFTIASLSLFRRPSSSSPPPSQTPASLESASPPRAGVAASSTRDFASPYFSLLHSNEPDALPQSVQDLLHYNLPTSDVAQTAWYLDLSTCSLGAGGPTSSTTARAEGLWLSQSAAASIGEIVGVSVLEGLAVPGVGGDPMGMEGGVPMVVDEMHDPLGLGVNIPYPSHLPEGPRYSWFDCFVDPLKPTPSLRYQARLSDARPALRISYLPRNEPGFMVHRIPVKSMSQVYAILEVLRDETWMIEFLRSASWQSDFEQLSNANETYVSVGPEGMDDEEVDLDALLGGSYIPQSIPCTLSVLYPTYSPLASPPGHQGSFHLFFPVPLPGSPMATVTVSHDLDAPVGVSVLISVDGLLPDPNKLEALQKGAAEFVRRGGGLKVARWIWEHSRMLLAST